MEGGKESVCACGCVCVSGWWGGVLRRLNVGQRGSYKLVADLVATS